MKKRLLFPLILFLTFHEVVLAGCISGDCKNGYGSYQWAGRSTYSGYWQNGKKHGQGEESWLDGAQYKGYYQNGRFYGQGTFIWKDGSKYVGEWQNGKRHGQGVWYSADGAEQKACFWEKGKCILPIKPSVNLPNYSSPTQPPSQPPSVPVIENRTALVIGNSDYRTVVPLRNPVNDALAMADVLQQVNFEVMLYTNIVQNDMEKAIDDFGDQLIQKGGVGLFYFAGHGMQANGQNYLIPTDAKIHNELDVKRESVQLARMMRRMENARNRMNIIILDACRDNPFAENRSFFRSMTINRGLARITRAPSGTYIAFATAPGSVASDGPPGKHGLYTQALIEVIKTPGLKIEDIFKRVRTQVRRKSQGSQIPWDNSSIEGDFYFVK